MNRTELLQLLVLNAICDDFENVDQVIFPDVAAQGAKCGVAVSRSDVLDTLHGLLEAGLAKAYRLSGSEPSPEELLGMPLPDGVDERSTYFYITQKGMALHRRDTDAWPFDPEGSVRPDWRPTEG